MPDIQKEYEKHIHYIDMPLTKESEKIKLKAGYDFYAFLFILAVILIEAAFLVSQYVFLY